MLGSGMNLITTIIGFGMSATFIAFICTRLICGRLRRIEERQLFELDSRIDIEMPGHRANGLEPIVIAAIPTMHFNRETFSSVDDAQCAICLADYQEKEMLRIMPTCGHSFHLSCIDVWLRKQSTCPVCRLSLQDSVDAKQLRSATLSPDQSINDSDTIAEHSQQWLLPEVELADGHADSISSDRVHRAETPGS